MSIFHLAALVTPDNLPTPHADQSTLNKIFSLLFVTLGSAAILMMVIGGIQYVTARSNAEAVSKARNRITYSLIGLIIVAVAAGIVHWVLGAAK